MMKPKKLDLITISEAGREFSFVVSSSDNYYTWGYLFTGEETIDINSKNQILLPDEAQLRKFSTTMLLYNGNIKMLFNFVKSSRKKNLHVLRLVQHFKTKL